MEIPNLPEVPEIWQNTINWQPNTLQQSKFQELYAAILIGNSQQNLTRITAPQDFWEKHLWDSLFGIIPLLQNDSTESVENKTPQNAKIVDIGTGAGFPGLPIAIIQPNWNVTLLDSTRKKIAFIERATAKLQLNNTKTIVSRAENVGRRPQHRESYDIALIRAVAQPSVCAEYVLPLVKLGGLGVLYRGRWEQEDTSDLASALTKLGGKIEFVRSGETPITKAVRHCIYLRKVSPTNPKYPRNVGIPHQQPL